MEGAAVCAIPVLVLIAGIVLYVVSSKSAANKLENMRSDIDYQLHNTNGFHASQSVVSINGKTGLAVDENANLICLVQNNGNEGIAYKVLPTSDLISAEIVSGGKTSGQVAGRAIAGAVVGNVLFGDVGAMVGSNVAGAKAALDVDNISLILTVNDTQIPNFPIIFSVSGLKNKQAAIQARQWMSILEIMARRAEQMHISAPTNSGWMTDQKPANVIDVAPEQQKPRELPKQSSINAGNPVCELRSAAAPNSYPVRVDQTHFTIGRAATNDLILQDPKVSRQHAVLRYAGNGWQIEDANSTGGVFVNQRRVDRAALQNGDQIRIGASVFIFRAV